MHFFCYTDNRFQEAGEAASTGEHVITHARQRWTPLLQSLGGVEWVETLDDSLLERIAVHGAAGTSCHVLAFSPPHTIDRELPYPVIPVFSWCYQNLPSMSALGNAQDCWVTALAHFGCAICHSRFARDVVNTQVAPAIVSAAIGLPALVPARAGSPARTPLHDSELCLSAQMIDSRDFCISADTLYPDDTVCRPFALQATPGSSSRKIELEPGDAGCACLPVGFYPPEGWGAWTHADNAWILLPQDVCGTISLRITLAAYGKNTGRNVFLHVGENISTLLLTSDLSEYELTLHLDAPVNYLRFSNLDHSLAASVDDPRKLGIGVGAIRIQSFDGLALSTVAHAADVSSVHLEGVVYSAFLDSLDERENWVDILTAFCYAFREEPDATLLLCIGGGELVDYVAGLFEMLCQLQPFKCRVVVVHGELGEQEYAQLRDITSFVVNASRAAGLCVQLEDAMACGIPAIAPLHTALADFITPDNAFVVAATPEPTHWPQDPAQVLHTYWYRPSWESLLDAYRESYRVATEDAARYAAMARAAQQAILQVCSPDTVAAQLEAYFGQLDEVAATP